MSASSDLSIVPETTLPETPSEAMERRRAQRERPVVLVGATQVAPVEVRMEDEVHDIREEVRRLAMRFDGLEERFDSLERNISEQSGQAREWSEQLGVKLKAMDDNSQGMATTLLNILGQLAEIRSRGGPAE